MIDLNALANGPHLAGNPAVTDPKARQTAPKPGKRKDPVPAGHVAAPGTGPAGETCGSCRHLFRNEQAKVYLKCGLNESNWTGGRKTDVRARDAACEKWESKA